MGLSFASTGKNAVDAPIDIIKNNNEKIIALAGNPNVGKSTLFNNLTGMNQHTGNWTGKTVANAVGRCKKDGTEYVFVDIPGTYSLVPHSAEEEVASDYICFGDHDCVVVVCDSTCLERNLSLVLQITEACNNVVVCVNLLDEAKRKHITIDLEKLSEELGVSVVGTIACDKKCINKLLDAIDGCEYNDKNSVVYPQEIESAVLKIAEAVKDKISNKWSARWVAVKLLENDRATLEKINIDIIEDKEIKEILEANINKLPLDYKDVIAKTYVEKSQQIAKKVCVEKSDKYISFDMKLDKFLTSKAFGFPVMILLLLFVFWITITVANYPSRLLSDMFLKFQDAVSIMLLYVNTPLWLHDVIVCGVLRVLCWVVSVMLPPMAIFFPMFTLLEDFGYLPRVAFNLDKPFKKCNACGKQALTMCMGFGCNAAGVTGCRIIDSPRERLIAILTNSFVPCNGRFPMLITIITMFFVLGKGFGYSILASVILTIFIVLGIVMTFLVSNLLSKTFLKGKPSSFILELPPYRKPQIAKTLVRSLFDRTLFVLGRAVAVAAPAGLVIWIMANVTVNDITLLSWCSGFLDPLGKLMGMDGVILMAFILAFPANEIVLPIIIMTYLAKGTITDTENVMVVRQILIENGWTWLTALCTMMFSLFHWPCSTTVLTIKKETGSFKWTVLSILLPTVIGVTLCIAINLIFNF